MWYDNNGTTEFHSLLFHIAHTVDGQPVSLKLAFVPHVSVRFNKFEGFGWPNPHALSCSAEKPCMNTGLCLSTQMIDTVTEPGAQPFGVQVKTLMDLEAKYQPKLSGLRLIETSQDNGLRMTTRLRELEVKDLLSLTRFFGFSSDTFSLAISLLDRFLSVMKVCKYYSLLQLLSWI